MKIPNAPKISVMMLQMSLYKNALNFRTLEGEPMTTPGCEDQTWLSAGKFLRIFASLPRKVREGIQRVWDEEPARNPATGERYPAPLLIFAHSFAELAAQIGRPVWAKNEGNVFWFDADVILDAPLEISGHLIAHQLAFTYQVSKHGAHAFQREGFQLEANCFAQQWGYPLLDERLWETVKHTENPHLRFHSELFARFGYRPQTAVDIKRIEGIYINQGMPELVDALHKPSNSEFSLNSAIDETNQVPGLPQRIIREHGELCDRCGATGKHRQLYLYRLFGMERFPEMQRDERSLLVLCSLCLREFAWTRFVFGASQPQKVVNLYRTLGAAAGKRLLSLFQDKCGDSGPVRPVG